MASKTMTLFESISSEQIGQIQDRLGAALQTSGLQSGPVERVLAPNGQGNQMIAAMVVVARNFVEAGAKEIVRRVKVDRTIEPQAMLDALGRNQYTDNKVVATMPRGDGEEVDFVFFKPEPEEYTCPGDMSDVDLAKALGRRGLIADPYAQAQANKDDPALADDRPNGTHWKDGESYNFAMFHRRRGKLEVNVDSSGGSWDAHWWFGGSLK